MKSDNWKPPESNCGKKTHKLLNQNAKRKYILALAHQSSFFTVNIIGSHWNLIFSLKQIQETKGAQLTQRSRPQKRQWCRRRKVVNVCRRKPGFFVYGVAGARVFGSLVPAWHLWSSKTSPCISLQSPVHTPKPQPLPSSQPKWMFVHWITSPWPQSPVPTPKTPAPPVPNLNGCLFIVQHLHV